jgi:nitrite reductase/ring-hydroxylating ferredoxin subunit
MSRDYAVASVDELPEGAHIVVEVQGREVGVFNVAGAYYALPNACFHQNGPLCRGAMSGTVVVNAETQWKRTWAMQGEIVVCPWHALEFHVPTGQCLAYPKRKLPTWPVRVEGTQIIVSM